jgi:hypothetical protein
MAKVFDDLATRFMSFSDALESQFGDFSIDFSLPSKTLKSSKAGAGPSGAAGDARALSAAAEEREAAKKRGEEILQQLPPGYFQSSFDALKHELCQLGPDARQDDVDVVVDRLTAAMEVRTWASREVSSCSVLVWAVLTIGLFGCMQLHYRCFCPSCRL